MFRRKKSSTDVSQRSVPALNISGPMRIAAQAPQASSMATPMPPSPLYSRFAKSAGGNVNAGQVEQTRAPTQYTRSEAPLDGREDAVRRSEMRQERAGLPGGASTRSGGRTALAISTPSRDDVSRNAQQRRNQQVSPPSSPIYSNANGNARRAAEQRVMPNIEIDALEDPPPRTNLHVKNGHELRKREAAGTQYISAKEEAKVARKLRPPSPSPPASSTSRPDNHSSNSLSSTSTPLRSRTVTNPPPPSFSVSAALPSSSANEAGILSSPTTLKSSPSLGNSLETRHGPPKAKYSPLAAFGPSISTSTSTGSSSSVSLSQNVPPPVPPKPLMSVASPTTSTFGSNSSLTAPDLGPISDLSPDCPSVESFTYSDRHASVQPLKTASVELRVGLGVDELHTFHSPLFGAGFGTRSREKHEQDDRNDLVAHTEHDVRPLEEANSGSLQNLPAVKPSLNRISFLDSDADTCREDEGRNGHIKMQGSGRNGRAATTFTSQFSPADIEPGMPPTPPSPSVPPSHILSSEYGGERLLETHPSVSNIPTAQRTQTMFEKYNDEHVSSLQNVHRDHPQTPRTVMRSQIPTPPTSVDGHGLRHEQSNDQRLTIASVLDNERSPDAPSPSPLDSLRVRKSSASRLTEQDASSPLPSYSASADVQSDGHVAREESHADNIATNEMTGRTMLTSSVSASNANHAHADGRELLGRPTPKLRTQNLPVQAQTVIFDRISQHHAPPLSPPQSPPQTVAPPFSTSQSRSRARSKSRSRSNRPDTASSSHSQHYVPPSSASSSDGPGRSPSALSALNPFSSNSATNGNSSTRKLIKTPPLSARGMGENASAAEQYRRQYQNEHLRGTTESSDNASMLVDADPFAKGEIVRELPISSGEVAFSASAGSFTPPVAPFAQTHSSGSSDPQSPATAGDYFSSRTRRRGERLDEKPRNVATQAVTSMQEGMEGEETPRPLAMDDQERDQAEGALEQVEPTFYPLEKHLMHAELLVALLPYIAFRDWCSLIAVNDAIRRAIEHKRELREVVLEHFLHTVGYTRWRWSTKEHIMLTFRDLNSYMRGVSIPTHQYATYAKAFLDAKRQVQKQPEDEYLKFSLKAATTQKSLLASSCRAYTRVVLRLRAQAEAMERDVEGDEKVYQFTPPQSTTSVHSKAPAPRSVSRVRGGTTSRPASPTLSSMSHSQHGHFASETSNGHAKVNRYERTPLAGLGPHFRSPLFRLGHAPCLRVCVPSPEGEWLADASVMECERELKRAGVVPLLRVGDVVWDTAVGDEGNIGRMVWDGNYLIDLDYTYSRMGEVPQYLHTLSFPPSYFHRVIRTPGNPICHIDISPWGEEIAANLQLLQDRIKTETPQGGHHTVVRWIHRSKFRIRPNPYTNAPVPIPDTSLAVDPGWYGTIIIEIEGTNEGLADLQHRCRSAFPPRAIGADRGDTMKTKPPSREFRLLRERSRPGEIWLRAIREKDRVL